MANNSMRQITILYGNATDDIKFNITTNLTSSDPLDTINKTKTDQGEIFVYDKQYAGKKLDFYVVPESAYEISSVSIGDDVLKAIEDIEVLENGEKNPKYDVNAKYKKLTYTYDMPANDITINVVFEEKTKYKLNLPENNEAALIKFGDYFKFNRYSKYDASLISETQNPETEEVESKIIDFTYELSGASQEANGTTYYAITNINSDEELPLSDAQKYYVKFTNEDHYINTLRFDKENIFVKVQKESDNIYTFTSYAEETCDNKYSDGKVYYTGINTIVDGESYFEVEVIENDADDSFVGKLFYINIKSISNLSSTKAYELYSAQMNNEFKLDNINKTPIMIYEGDNIDLTITPIFNKTYVEVLGTYTTPDNNTENLTISKASDTYSFIMPSDDVNIALNTYINELHIVSLDNVENANIKIKNAYPMYEFTRYNSEDENDKYSGECRRLNNIIYQDGKAYEEIEILHSSDEENDVYLESHYVLADIFKDDYEGEKIVDSYTYDDRINKLVPTIITMYKENQDMPDGIEEYKATVKFELGNKKEEIKYYAGETVKFDAITPDKGYYIKDISINYTKTTDDVEEEISEKINNYFTMPNADVTVKANVVKKSTTYNILYGNWEHIPQSYNITVGEVSNANYDIPSSAKDGDKVELSIFPAPKYKVTQLLVNGEEIQPISSNMYEVKYVFIMPEEDVNIEVTTEALQEYSVSANIDHIEGLNSPYLEGDTVKFTVNVDEGYRISSVRVNGEEISGNNGQYSFTMPANDVSIEVAFEEIPKYRVIIGNIENGKVVADYNDNIYEGTTVTLTITPNKGYALNSIIATSENFGEIAIDNNKFIMPADNVTIEATFNSIPMCYVGIGNPENTENFNDIPENNYIEYTSTVEGTLCIVVPNDFYVKAITVNDSFNVELEKPEQFNDDYIIYRSLTEELPTNVFGVSISKTPF